jgi:hypothetical protein
MIFSGYPRKVSGLGEIAGKLGYGLKFYYLAGLNEARRTWTFNVSERQGNRPLVFEFFL